MIFVSGMISRAMFICLICFPTWMIRLQKPKSRLLAGRISWIKWRNGNLLQSRRNGLMSMAKYHEQIVCKNNLLQSKGNVWFQARTKKPLGQSTSANTLMGRAGRQVITPGRYAFSGVKERRESNRINPVIPLNYVALQKDESTS